MIVRRDENPTIIIELKLREAYDLHFMVNQVQKRFEEKCMGGPETRALAASLEAMLVQACWPQQNYVTKER